MRSMTANRNSSRLANSRRPARAPYAQLVLAVPLAIGELRLRGECERYECERHGCESQ